MLSWPTRTCGSPILAPCESRYSCVKPWRGYLVRHDPVGRQNPAPRKLGHALGRDRTPVALAHHLASRSPAAAGSRRREPAPPSPPRRTDPTNSSSIASTALLGQAAVGAGATLLYQLAREHLSLATPDTVAR